jgi:hypothetical protein
MFTDILSKRNTGIVIPTVYTVHNIKASSYEYNFAVACDYWGLDYFFQYAFFGGHNVLGGLVLDFLVYTQPLSTPVWINGSYWHAHQRREIDMIQQLLVQEIGGTAPAKEYWQDDVGTIQDAIATVRRDLA